MKMTSRTFFYLKIVSNSNLSQFLRMALASTDCCAVAADGDDVYVGGYIQSKDFKKEGAAVIWIDGEMTLFTEKVGIEVGGLMLRTGTG